MPNQLNMTLNNMNVIVQNWYYHTKLCCWILNIQARDADNSLIFTVDGTLSHQKWERLLAAILAFCQAGAVNLKDQDMATLSRTPEFSALHFTYYGRFGQSMSFFQ